VVCRKSNLNLFISKFSNLADCTLVHWPSQQDMMDGSTVDTQKHQVIHLHRDDPHNTLLTGLTKIV